MMFSFALESKAFAECHVFFYCNREDCVIYVLRLPVTCLLYGANQEIRRRGVFLRRLQPPIESGATPRNRKPAASSSRGLISIADYAAGGRRQNRIQTMSTIVYDHAEPGGGAPEVPGSHRQDGLGVRESSHARVVEFHPSESSSAIPAVD